MNKSLLYGTLAVAAVGIGVLTPVAVGAVANHYRGNPAVTQAVRARDGSGVGVQTNLHTETQDRQYIHQDDGTCDGTGVGDGTGAQQRQHGRQ